MKVILTNLGTVAVPIASSQDKGYVAALQPGVPFTLDAPPITVAVIGENPSFLEDLGNALSGLLQEIQRLIDAWRGRGQATPHAGTPGLMVRIQATGTNGIRVLQGDDRNLDHEVAPGETFDANAPDYIELRELGVGGAAMQPEAP